MCDVSDQLVADLGHIREGSGVSAVMEVTALPLSPPVRCIVAQGSNLIPRLASAADEYELAFASPPDDVALGVGWNFLFVGATTLLTRTYAGVERGKVLALNDFLVFGTVTLSSFASGAMLSGAGWIKVQIAVVPFVVVAGVAVLWWRHRDPSATAMLRPAEPV